MRRELFSRFCFLLLRLAHIRGLACATLALVMARHSIRRTVPFFTTFVTAAFGSARAIAKLAIRELLDEDRGRFGHDLSFGARDRYRRVRQPILRREPRRGRDQNEQDQAKSQHMVLPFSICVCLSVERSERSNCQIISLSPFSGVAVKSKGEDSGPLLPIGRHGSRLTKPAELVMAYANGDDDHPMPSAQSSLRTEIGQFIMDPGSISICEAPEGVVWSHNRKNDFVHGEIPELAGATRIASCAWLHHPASANGTVSGAGDEVWVRHMWAGATRLHRATRQRRRDRPEGRRSAGPYPLTICARPNGPFGAAQIGQSLAPAPPARNARRSHLPCADRPRTRIVLRYPWAP